MPQRFTNAARAALSAPIGAGDTSLTIGLTVADLFPAANTGTDPVNTPGKDWFKIVLEDVNHNYEIIYVRTRTLGSGVMSNLLRGQEGTTAISFAATSTVVGLRITAEDNENALELASQATTAGKAMLFAADADAQAQLIGGALQKNLATAFTTSGSGTAYAITPTPAVTAYVANLAFDITFHVASGNNPTLQISGLATPPNLVRRLANGGYTNIKPGEIPVGQRSRVVLISPTQALVETPMESMDGVAGADIVSASALDLTGRTGSILRLLGTTAITSIIMGNGDQVLLTADAAAVFNVAGLLVYTCNPEDSVLLWQDGDGVQHAHVLEVNLPGKVVGEVFEYAGTTAPAGALVCPTAQTNLSRTTYARLFAAIGTTWGAGDGSTTFGMPWFPANYASVQANGNVGTSTVGENLAHTHAPSAGGSFYSNGGGSGDVNGDGSALRTSATTTSNGGSANLPAGVRMLKCVKY